MYSKWVATSICLELNFIIGPGGLEHEQCEMFSMRIQTSFLQLFIC